MTGVQTCALPISQGPYEPALNQRFLGNTNECYYTYQPNPLYPKLVELDDLSLRLDRRGILAGLTDCPPVDTGFTYLVIECNTNISYRFNSFEVFQPETRVSNASGNTYTIEGTFVNSTLPLLTDLKCVDENGNLQGSPKFTFCVLNCPAQAYYKISRCSNSKIKRVTRQTASELAQQGYNLGDVVFTNADNECYTMESLITDIRGLKAITFTSSQKMDSCFQCTNSYFEDPDQSI